jgi:DNA polymerase sigma
MAKKRSSVKRAGKALVNKIRSFDVFKNKTHENQYESLDADEESPKKRQRVHDVILIDDESGSDHEVSILNPIDVNESVEIPTTNELVENNDFISLKFSDSEEESEDEVDNEEDAYSVDDYETNMDPLAPILNTDAPWIQNHDHSEQKEIADWLTMEIKDFIAYISPAKAEIEARNSCVRRLRDAVTKLWKDSEVHVFGSSATDLYLPGSDIDMVIVSDHGGYGSRNSLYQLSSYLKKLRLATNVEVVAHARVPIIKLTEPQTNIHIDISFERTNGIEAASVILSWLRETPGLRELVLIVKQFLAVRKLNNVRHGGLGGFSTICLVYSFLRLHPRVSTGNIDVLDNLGVLLIEFFELYGKNFSYDNIAISVADDDVCYLRKSDYKDLQGRSSFTLAIQDPSDPSNNISRGSFNVLGLKKAFNGAFWSLANQCYDMELATYKERLGESILGSVVKYRGKERDFNDERSLVLNEAMSEVGSVFGGKSYYSDRSLTSSDEEEVEEVKQPEKKKQRVEDSEERKKIEGYMGLEEDSDDYAAELVRKSSSSSLDKKTKRNYWVQKGNAIA